MDEAEVKAHRLPRRLHADTTLSRHGKLRIVAIGTAQQAHPLDRVHGIGPYVTGAPQPERPDAHTVGRSEEHTSELQSQSNLVCRLLLETNTSRESVILFNNTALGAICFNLILFCVLSSRYAKRNTAQPITVPTTHHVDATTHSTGQRRV